MNLAELQALLELLEECRRQLFSPGTFEHRAELVGRIDSAVYQLRGEAAWLARKADQERRP